MSQFQRFLIGSLLLFCLLNIGGLWGVTFLKQQKAQAALPSATETELTAQLEALTSEVASLKTQVASLMAAAKTTPSSGTTTTTTPTSVATSSQPTSAPQEQVIFIGTGSTTERDWTTMTGATVTINKALYPRIKQVTFEASLSIVGGEAQARVVNTTTGAILDTTTVAHNRSTAVWTRSPAFNFFTGSNTYAVQLRSTSGELARLEGSRFIIVTQ